MGVVEEGVANFRDFQATARDFFSRADERAENQKEFQETRDKEIKAAIERRERRFTHLTVIAGILFTATLVMLAILTYRDSKRAAENVPPHSVSEVQSPQNAAQPMPRIPQSQ